VDKKSKIKADVIFSNNFDLSTYESVIRNSVCAVIDTLMAVSTITAIFGSNCKRLILAREKYEAYLLKEILKDYLLVGEENGIPPEGFDYGNRPLNFVNIDLSNKRIILSTTNGSVSFFKLLGSEAVFAISLLNLDYSLNVILNLAQSNEKNILFLCSGRKGFTTYDDVYTAGLAIKNLNKLADLELSDSAKVALESASFNNGSILDAISNSESGDIVKRLGYLDDLIYCANINEFNTTPRLVVLELNNKKDFHESTDLKDFHDVLLKSGKKYPYETLLLLEPFNNIVKTRKEGKRTGLKYYKSKGFFKYEKKVRTY